jgi:heme/copper-type cytochrome/quinol oxidase subunit 3
MNFLFKTVVFLNRKSEHKTTGEIMTGLVMAAIFMLFLPLIIVLLHNRFAGQLSLPKEFGLSTLLLVATMWMIHSAKHYRENDQYKKLRKVLKMQLSLALLFLLMQFLGGWKIVVVEKYHDVKIIALLVLYHSLHLCVAIGLLLKLLVKTKSIHSSAECFIYFLEPNRHFAFRLSVVFWNFLSMLWIALYVLMLLKFN